MEEENLAYLMWNFAMNLHVRWFSWVVDTSSCKIIIFFIFFKLHSILKTKHNQSVEANSLLLLIHWHIECTYSNFFVFRNVYFYDGHFLRYPLSLLSVKLHVLYLKLILGMKLNNYIWVNNLPWEAFIHSQTHTNAHTTWK